MATTETDGCFQRAEKGEELFTLLARDPDAPLLVELWAALRAQREGVTPQVTEARECAERMRAWRSTRRPPVDTHAHSLLVRALEHYTDECSPGRAADKRRAGELLDLLV